MGRSLAGITADEFIARSTENLVRLPGAPARDPRTLPIPLVSAIALQNKNAEQVVVLTLGEKPMALAAAFSAMEARQLAAALVQHAELLDAAALNPPATEEGPTDG